MVQEEKHRNQAQQSIKVTRQSCFYSPSNPTLRSVGHKLNIGYIRRTISLSSKPLDNRQLDLFNFKWKGTNLKKV